MSTMQISASVKSASYYAIEGWAWCPDNPSAIPHVSLISQSGEILATQLANRNVSSDDKSSQKKESNGFVFYGLLDNVAGLKAFFEDKVIEIPVLIEKPHLTGILEGCGFFLIHPDDYLFRFNLNKLKIEDCVHSYIGGGKGIAQNLKNTVSEYMHHKEKPFDLLDFASGYGRVTAFLDPSVFNITASDIHQEAMTFIENRVKNCNTILSKTNPQDFIISDTFDVIFAFSFFSHLPHSTFGDWISTLYGMLRPNGLLIFTTHGKAAKYESDVLVDESGFGYYPLSEQEDLNSADYGISISELPYVINTVRKHTLQYPVLFQESSPFTGGGQDLYIVRKGDLNLSLDDTGSDDLFIENETFSKEEVMRMILPLKKALQEQEAAFYSSTSWKLTRPLRAVKHWLTSQI